MKAKNGLARFLVIAGACVLFLSAAVHTFAAYPRVAMSVGSSNLTPTLQAALRAVFLLAGWNWFTTGLLALIAALRPWPHRKLLILYLSGAVLIETMLTLAIMGVFIGNELLGVAAILLGAGGMMLERRENVTL